MEAVAIVIYFLALVIASYCCHCRYACVKASLLAGFVASFLTFSSLLLFDGNLDPRSHLAAFIVYGTGLWGVSALLSGFLGAAVQIQKK